MHPQRRCGAGPLKRTVALPGLRPGDEILVLNGGSVSSLDLSLIQTRFAEPTLHLSLRRDGPRPPAASLHQPATPLRQQRDAGSKHQRAKSSSGDDALEADQRQEGAS